MVGSTELFRSEINKNRPEFEEPDHAVKFLVTRMHSDEEKIKLGGGLDSTKRQHAKGRLTARAFCSGLDLEGLQQVYQKGYEENYEDSQVYAKLLTRLYRYPKPVIAVINGAAVAGGCGLVTVCDSALAASTAKFGYTEVKIGFVAAVGAPFLLGCVGEKATRDLLLTARLIQATEAKQLGLVNQVVYSRCLRRCAAGLARSLCENSLQSVPATKQWLAKLTCPDLERLMSEACELNTRSRSMEDGVEGVRAFFWRNECHDGDPPDLEGRDSFPEIYRVTLAIHEAIEHN